MRTAKTCLFGGALIAAGLAAGANAQCDPMRFARFTFDPSNDPSGFDSQSSILDTTVSNGVLYVTSNANNFDTGTEEFALRAFDVSTPGTVTELPGPLPQSTRFFADRRGLAVAGTTLVGRGSGGLDLYDITDFTNPQPLPSIPLAAPGSGIKPGALFAQGTTLYAVEFTNPSRLRVIDLSTPTSPQDIGSYQFTTGAVNIGQPVGTEIPFRDNDEYGVIDISDPANPQALFRSVGPRPFAMEAPPVIAGNTLVQSNSGDETIFFDFTDPANPVRLPDLDTGLNGAVSAAASSGLFAFIGEQSRLVTIDLSTPATPIVANLSVESQETFQFVVSGGTLASASASDSNRHTLDFFDISACAVQPVVEQSPFSRIVPESDTPEVLSVKALSATDYRWLRDGRLVEDDGDVSGDTTNRLSVKPNPRTEGVYTVQAINPDGTDTSAPAFFGVRANPASLPGCNAADLVIPFGVLDLDDIDAFIASFTAQCP